MQLNKELYYPTPIYYFDFDEAESLNHFLLTRINTWREEDTRGIERSNVRRIGGWHSATTMAERPEYKLFVDKLNKAMLDVFADQLYPDHVKPLCHNMWANINPPGGYNRSHTHPGSLWSGVYYVQTPLDSGRVVFQDPRPQVEMLMVERDPAKNSSEHWREVYHRAIAGRLIIFPSWLRHEVEPNMSRQPAPFHNRISISFNYGQVVAESTP